MTKKVYILENLGCANCAAKMETRICALPGVESAVITYATKQLRLCCENPDEVLPQIQAICSSIEPGTIVIERKRSSSKDQSSFNRHTHTASCTCSHDHSHEHHHDTSCDCGHDHSHEHHHDTSCDCDHDHSHEHHHDTSCDCDHDHSHEHHHDTSCGCGHDHSHEHHHDTSCDCGHDHSHEHHHVEGHPADCDCELCHPHEDYCDICGESLSNCTCRMPDATNKKRVFILENLGCANCAAKMEAKIKALPEVDYAALTFPTKQLRISAKDPEALLPVLQSICSSIEPEVVVVPRKHKVTQTKPVEEKKTVPDKTPKKKKLFQKENLELITIIIGGVLFLFGEILHEAVFDGASFPPVLIALSLIAYLILGWNLLVTAFKNIRSGQIFDENFLMSIATLGALAIQNYMEAVGVVLFFRIGEYFEHRAVENSRKSIMDAVDMRPDVVQLLIGEEIKIIDAEDAIVGDILLVRPGDRIPLDGVIIEGESQIDTSPVTGEPVPVAAHYGDEVVSGCINTSGLLKIRVEKPLEESMVTRILDSVENATANKPQIERFITKFARIYTPIVVVAAILVAFIPSLNLLPILPESGNWNYWIHTALTFLVISCPCALVLSVPLAFFSGIGAGSKKGILFKGGSSLEAIKQVSAVILDKTGTITYGDFRVQKVGTIAEYSDQDVLSYCASCELNSTHPIGNSIVDYAKEKNISLSRPSSVKEIAGKGIEAVLGEDIVLCGNKKLMEEYQIDTSNYQNELFGTEVLVAINHELIGYLILSDTIKPESKEAISKINHLSIHTVMLTGDAKDSANAVAKETGIKEVHSKLLPQDKLSRLKTIREQHGKVMFVGDGINDAPVLSGADVGAAMGSGSDVAIEAADVVFMNSNLTAIPESIEIAKDSSNAAMQNVVFALIIKAIVMILGLIGHASMWFAVFADSGVAILCVLNSIRILYKYRKKN